MLWTGKVNAKCSASHVMMTARAAMKPSRIINRYRSDKTRTDW